MLVPNQSFIVIHEITLVQSAFGQPSIVVPPLVQSAFGQPSLVGPPLQSLLPPWGGKSNLSNLNKSGKKISASQVQISSPNGMKE